MELGGMTEFRHVPQFRGNRDLPEDKQVSVMVKRLTAIDVLQDLTPEQLHRWRDEAFHRWAVTEKEGNEERVLEFEKEAAGLEMVPTEMLTVFRRVITHTHGFRNISYNGREVTDAAEIFLLARIPDSLDQTDNLLVELYNVLRDTASMTDEELKNWSTPSTGGTTPQSTSATGAEGGASRRGAKGKGARPGN